MENRTKHVIRNLNFSVIYQIVNIIIKFILRTIFIHFLGKEYLGINGLFTSILTVLSLSELGLGTAIIYDMYKPIHDKNTAKITQLFKFYKYIYIVIGTFIFIAGLCLIPFLKYLISDIKYINNIYFIYILQLISTSASYFFAQYRTLIDANQLNELNTRNNIRFNILRTILQSLALMLFRNYIVYLLIELITQVVSNYFIYLKCKKIFPYINQKVEKLPKGDKSHIFKNALSMFSIKIGTTVLNATDNIVISSMISTVVVGIYSNYTLITTVITASTMMISGALQASVGNLCVSSDYEKRIKVFERIRFLYVSIYSIIFCCLIILMNNFITIWIGQDYLLNMGTVFLILLNLYFTGVHQPIEIYIYADGLFRYFKIKPWIEAGINLSLSLILAKYIGILGVLLGTTISHIATTLWYDSYIVFKYSLKQKLMDFFKKYLDYMLSISLVTIIAFYICNCINIGNEYVSFGIKGICCITITSALWIIRYIKNENLIYYKNLVLNLFKRALRKEKNVLN